MDKVQKAMTTEQRTKNYKNKMLARKYFGIENNKEYVLHHKDQNLRKNDLDRYVQWNIEDLEVMQVSEHLSLHHKGKIVSDAQKEKQREKMKGRTPWNKNMKGVYTFSDESKENIRRGHIGLKCSDETKKKISEANKGSNHWDEEKRKLHSEQMKKIRTGYKLSDETKQKISNAHKGKKKNYNVWNKGKHYKCENGKAIILEA